MLGSQGPNMNPAVQAKFRAALALFTCGSIICATPAPPVNDHFVDAEAISGAAGTTYHVQVDNADGAEGVLFINHWFGPVSIDHFENAGNVYRDRVSNAHATQQIGEPLIPISPMSDSKVRFWFLISSVKTKSLTRSKRQPTW